MWLLPLSDKHTLSRVSFCLSFSLLTLSISLILSLSLCLFPSFCHKSTHTHTQTHSDKLTCPVLLKNCPTQTVRRFISQHQFLMTFPNAPVSINTSRLFNETRIWIISPILSSSHILRASTQRDPTRVFQANPSIDVRKDLLVGLVSHCNKNLKYDLRWLHKYESFATD